MGRTDRDSQEFTESLARVAKALSDPKRLEMLALMSRGSACCSDPGPLQGLRPPGVCVCEIQQLLGLAQSRVSYHLRILKEAGLITETNRGKWTFYNVDTDALRSALSLIEGKILGAGSAHATSKGCG